MNLYGLSPEIAQRFAGSLLHFIWQGALIAFLAAICLKLLSKRSAEVRYIVSSAVMALMLAAPVMTFAFYGQTGAIALRLLQMTQTTRAVFRTSVPLSSSSQTTATWAHWILLAWCAGVFVFLARLIVGWYLSNRMVRTSEDAVPARIRSLFEDIYDHLALSKPIRLLVQVRIDTPLVVGWFRPAVLLPISAISGLSEEQLRGIFAHELAHIRRHDFLVNILQRCVEALLFYHPAVWWLSNRVRIEREDCCDDLAVKLCGNRRNYAEALVALERQRQDRQALAVAATNGSLVHRIQRILGLESSGVDWQSAVVTVLFLGIWIVAGMWHSTPLVAQPTVSMASLSSALSPIAPAAPAPPAVSSAVTAIAAIITAQPVPAEPAQAAPVGTGPGIIEGVVTRRGSTSPVPDVHVDLSTNSAPTPKAVQDFVSYFASRGVAVTPPENGQMDQKFIQQVMDAAAKRGVSMVDPDVRNAVMQFQFSSRKNFVAFTDAAGRFRIENLPPGKYSLNIGRDDYFDAKGADAVVLSGKTAEVALSMIPGRPAHAQCHSHCIRVVVSKRPSHSPSNGRGNHGRPRGLSDFLASARRILHRCNAAFDPATAHDDQCRDSLSCRSDCADLLPRNDGRACCEGTEDQWWRTHFRYRYCDAYPSGSASHFRCDPQFLQDRHGQRRARSRGFEYSI
jgi:beta-lactamase regulating signal transducer with metallopeptidase domain